MGFERIAYMFMIVLLLMLSSGCLGLTDPGNSSDPLPVCEYTVISADDACKLIKATDMFVLDVRSEKEFNSTHIERACNINVNELKYRLDEIPSENHVLVYCKSGSRSKKACIILGEAQYPHILNLDGGINKWRSTGHPCVQFDDKCQDNFTLSAYRQRLAVWPSTLQSQ